MYTNVDSSYCLHCKFLDRKAKYKKNELPQHTCLSDKHFGISDAVTDSEDCDMHSDADLEPFYPFTTLQTTIYQNELYQHPNTRDELKNSETSNKGTVMSIEESKTLVISTEVSHDQVEQTTCTNIRVVNKDICSGHEGSTITSNSVVISEVPLALIEEVTNYNNEMIEGLNSLSHLKVDIEGVDQGLCPSNIEPQIVSLQLENQSNKSEHISSHKLIPVRQNNSSSIMHNQVADWPKQWSAQKDNDGILYTKNQKSTPTMPDAQAYDALSTNSFLDADSIPFQSVYMAKEPCSLEESTAFAVAILPHHSNDQDHQTKFKATCDTFISNIDDASSAMNDSDENYLTEVGQYFDTGSDYEPFFTFTAPQTIIYHNEMYQNPSSYKELTSPEADHKDVIVPLALNQSLADAIEQPKNITVLRTNTSNDHGNSINTSCMLQQEDFSSPQEKGTDELGTFIEQSADVYFNNKTEILSNQMEHSFRSTDHDDLKFNGQVSYDSNTAKPPSQEGKQRRSESPNQANAPTGPEAQGYDSSRKQSSYNGTSTLPQDPPMDNKPHPLLKKCHPLYVPDSSFHDSTTASNSIYNATKEYASREEAIIFTQLTREDTAVVCNSPSNIDEANLDTCTPQTNNIEMQIDESLPHRMQATATCECPSKINVTFSTKPYQMRNSLISYTQRNPFGTKTDSAISSLHIANEDDDLFNPTDDDITMFSMPTTAKKGAAPIGSTDRVSSKKGKLKTSLFGGATMVFTEADLPDAQAREISFSHKIGDVEGELATFDYDSPRFGVASNNKKSWNFPLSKSHFSVFSAAPKSGRFKFKQ